MDFSKEIDKLEKRGFKYFSKGLSSPTWRKKLLNGDYLCVQFDGQIWLQCSSCVLLFYATTAKQVLKLFAAMNYPITPNE